MLISGKIYYELVKERQARGLDDKVAFVRIEELSPFPFHHVERVLGRYVDAREFVYLQEEPRNQGAWTHMSTRIQHVLEVMGRKDVELQYRGRKESALPAPGVGKLYAAQQKAVMESAFEGL